MCGIVGILGTGPVAENLVEALKRLEYRGYDSAGVATLEDGVMKRVRAEGKLINLSKRLDEQPLNGVTGIGHTRWATHGAPTEGNAHPHMSDKVAVVHNGIIENFLELKNELEADGYKASSQTDTEIVALMVTRALDKGATPEQAVGEVLPRLRGAFGLAFLFANQPDLLIAARQGSPLAIGHGNGEMFIGSDAFALAPFTNHVTYLEEGDWAVLTRSHVKIMDFEGRQVQRESTVTSASAGLVDKGNHRHFMAKEIYEQPEAISHTLSHYVDMATQQIVLREKMPIDPAKISRLNIVACGTAFYAGLVGKYWFEKYARIPVDIDVASEFRYREPPLDENALTIVISQSGETADTLAAMRYCADKGMPVAAIVNVSESTIAREADVVFPTLCGPEIGVASTKATTSQLTVLASLAVAFARASGQIDADQEQELVHALIQLPAAFAKALNSEAVTEAIAKDLSGARDVLYLGRGQFFPIALEGALKLKEITYIHAEGYAAGELKHGPIALIDENMPVVVVAPTDGLLEKTVSNIQEVQARGGLIILITDENGAAAAGAMAEEVVLLPAVPELIAPILSVLPVQLIAYHTAVHMGTDVDQPRNLAKSVTVE